MHPTIPVKIFCEYDSLFPVYETALASGFDLRSSCSGLVPAKGKAIVPTGVRIEAPVGFEIQIRPRSGMALKKGITVLNSPGTIDSDFRGEIQVILYNTTNEDYIICREERIAQAVLCPIWKADFVRIGSVEDFSTSERGEGGFGSTGIN